MRISKNFTMSEFSVSSDYPHLAKGVPVNLQGNIRALVENVLQPICDATGWSCKISSGYRSPELNRAVGGVPTSQHVRAEAGDCVFTKNKVRIKIIDVLRVAKKLNLPFDQMIAYPTFVHFSHTQSRANRKQVLYNKSYNGEKL